MKTLSSIADLRETITPLQRKKKIAFVPTMGNLHQGHIDLVDRAHELAEIVVVSIFVNPMQFSDGEDLDNYPRTLERDISKLEATHVDYLFAPDVSEIYIDNLAASTQVIVPGISSLWCGHSRAGHFEGVTTIVNKLFNLVQPNVAVFGEKDFQQLTIIKKMVSDLNMPIEIVGVPTRREEDGLAMSSRNGYLTEKEREIAPKLRQMLVNIQKTIKSSEKPDFQEIIDQEKIALNKAGFKTDYLAICRQSDLQLADPDDKDLIVLAAAYLGKARLIDNLILN